MKLIASGAACWFPTEIDLPRIWRGVRVERGSEDEPPFPIEALAVEDDTWQVLGADPDFHPAVEHPIRLMRALHDARPVRPGTVVVRGNDPTRFHAIVHDLDLEPTWTEAWIAATLKEILRISNERGYRALGLPLLGTRHGRLPDGLTLRLLDGALATTAHRLLRRLWLIG